MTQEIKVNLTLTIEADLCQSKGEIQNFIADIMISAVATKSFSIRHYVVNNIHEEAEIYAPNPKQGDRVWDFVEKHYPKYYSCLEILRNNELCKIVNSELNGDAKSMFKQEFAENYELVVAAFDQSTKYVYERAIAGFQRSQQNSISIVWSIEDVMERAKEGGYILKEGEALQVLTMLKKKHDCNTGISWDTIDDYLSIIVPESIEDGGFEWETIQFEKTPYLCRLVPDPENEGAALVVAPTALSHAMNLDENGKGSAEATLLDERIVYFASPTEMRLSNKDIFNLIYT